MGILIVVGTSHQFVRIHTVFGHIKSISKHSKHNFEMKKQQLGLISKFSNVHQERSQKLDF